MGTFTPSPDGSPPPRRNPVGVDNENALAPPLPPAATLSPEEIRALAAKHQIELPEPPISQGHHTERPRDQVLEGKRPQVQQVRDIW